MDRTPAGRVALAPVDWISRLGLSLVAVLPAFFIAELVFRAVTVFADDVPIGTRVLFGIGSAVAAFGSVVLIHALAHPTPVADFDAGRLLVGNASIAFLEIDDARVVPVAGRSAPVSRRDHGSVLRFGRAKTPSTRAVLADVPLAIAGRSPGGDLRRAALLVVLERSGIRMPSNPYDPTGRFAKYNFPENLDKDGAISFVLGDRGEEDASPQRPDP